MKKILAIMLVLSMIITVMVSCGQKKEEKPSDILKTIGDNVPDPFDADVTVAMTTNENGQNLDVNLEAKIQGKGFKNYKEGFDAEDTFYFKADLTEIYTQLMKQMFGEETDLSEYFPDLTAKIEGMLENKTFYISSQMMGETKGSKADFTEILAKYSEFVKEKEGEEQKSKFEDIEKFVNDKFDETAVTTDNDGSKNLTASFTKEDINTLLDLIPADMKSGMESVDLSSLDSVKIDFKVTKDNKPAVISIELGTSAEGTAASGTIKVVFNGTNGFKISDIDGKADFEEIQAEEIIKGFSGLMQ